MKITCTQQELRTALSTVGHAVSGRPTLPVLANILLKADRGRLELAATNLEIGINCRIDGADISEGGATTVPAKTFTDLVASLRPGPVELSLDEAAQSLSVKGAGCNATIRGLIDPTEFPQLPNSEGGDVLTLNSKLLKEMIAQTAIATADDDSRPVLTGIVIDLEDECLTFAGADAFRLALRKADVPSGLIDYLAPIIVPAKTLRELARILSGDDEVQMVVMSNRSQVLFHTARVDLVSRLIEGAIPNIKAAVPKEYITRAVVGTDDFEIAVKAITPFAREDSNIARIKIAPRDDGDGTLTLESSAADVGSNITTIPAAVQGPGLDIIFNSKYLIDVLAIMDMEKVALEVTSPGRPGVIKPICPPAVTLDYTYIIMPMSTNR